MTFFQRKYKGSSLGTAIPISQTLPKAFPELHGFSSSAGKGQGGFLCQLLVDKARPIRDFQHLVSIRGASLLHNLTAYEEKDIKG